MTNIEMYRTCEGRDDWRRLIKKASSAAIIDNDDADRVTGEDTENGHQDEKRKTKLAIGETYQQNQGRQIDRANHNFWTIGTEAI